MYEKELMAEVRAMTGLTEEEIGKALHLRAGPSLAPADAATSAQAWEAWVACVLARAAPGPPQAPGKWLEAYRQQKPGRELLATRHGLIAGQIPEAWAFKIGRGAWPDLVPEPAPAPAPAAVIGLTPEDKALRASRISATQATAIMRTSPYMTPIDVWRAHQPDAPEVEQSERMLLGSLLEAANNQRYKMWCESTGTDPGVKTRVNCETLVGGTGHGWMCATPDTLVWLADESVRIVELKAFGARPYEDGEAPGYVRDQVLWQAAVLESLGYVVSEAHASIIHASFGLDYRVYPIAIDRDRIDLMVKTCKQFYTDHIVAGVAPEVDITSTDELVKRYPGKGNGQVVDADPEILTTMAKLRVWYKREKIVGKALATLEGRIKDEIGRRGIDGFTGPDGETFAWRQVTGKKTTDYRGIWRAMGEPKELWEQHTTTGEPSRRTHTKGLKS